MEEQDIIALWRTYDRKLEETLSLNKKNAQDITRIKIKSLLGSMAPRKIFTLVTGILWIVLIDFILIVTYSYAGIFFQVSMIIQVLLTKIAVGVYIYQLVLIYQTDISEPLLDVQTRLARLQSSTLWVTRILFLQFPIWTTFFISEKILTSGNVTWWAIHIATTTIFTIPAVWLFMNIKYENRNARWFRLIFGGKDWDPVLRAAALLRETEEFRSEA